MPQLVLFGAGNIGRGFIAPLFTTVGWDVCFVDIDQDRVDAINKRGAYVVTEVEDDKRKDVKVKGITAIHPEQHDELMAMITQADVMATSVGLANLKHIAKDVAQGLAQRWQDVTKPVDLLVCENGFNAAQDLRKEIKSHLPQQLWPAFELDCGCVRTTIGRMIPPSDDPKSLDIEVEPYCYLPTERSGYRAPHPAIPHVDCVDNFDAYMLQKMFIHNCTHAAFGYSGLKAGYTHLPEAMDDQALVDRVYAASEEIIVAMVKEFGNDQRDRCRSLRDDLFKRYRNKALNDPLARLAWDPVRKLNINDRLVGAARFCSKHKVNCPQLCSLIRDVAAYEIGDNEPQAEEWRAWQKDGIRNLLSGVTGLDISDPLVQLISSSEGE